MPRTRSLLTPLHRAGAASELAHAQKSITLHERILFDIQENVMSGRWPPGYHIPSELEFAEKYGCARMTVNKVLSQLALVGLIERRRRAGSFVRAAQSRAAIMRIKDIRVEVVERGDEYGFRLLSRTKRKSRLADAERLLLAEGAPIVDLTYLHLASGAPFCVEERIINLSAVPTAKTADFRLQPSGEWLADEVPWTSADHRIRAEGANAKIAEALGVSEGGACLVVERRTWNSQRPVTHVRFTYPGASHEVRAHFSPDRFA